MAPNRFQQRKSNPAAMEKALQRLMLLQDYPQGSAPSDDDLPPAPPPAIAMGFRTAPGKGRRKPRQPED